jgi:hypothetical protein
MADDGSILAEEKEEAEEAVNESLPEWVTKLALPTLVIQAGDPLLHTVRISKVYQI